MKYVYSVINPKEDGPPFWISNTEPPKIDYIFQRGSNCAGLINLTRRYIGLKVFGNQLGSNIHFIGGTEAAFTYLKDMNRLIEIDFSMRYPKGSLLLQNYNSNDQGHLAIVIDSDLNGILESKIIHNINGEWNNKNYDSVIIEKIGDYPYYSRFTHICLPENWLFKN
jgi:hypothetical protein